MAVLESDSGLKFVANFVTLGLLRLYENTLLEPYDNWLLLMNPAKKAWKAFQSEKRLRVPNFIIIKFMHFIVCAIF